MKSPEQIKAWLEAQPWYGAFRYYTQNKNVNHTASIKIDSETTLSGRRGDSTINLAFIWAETNEGYEFWKNVDALFFEWYHEENPD